MTATATKITTRDLVDADAILQQFFGETEGEVTPELAELEAWLADAKEQKFERWGLFITREERGIAAIDDEIARLEARKEAWKKRVAHAKERLRFYMEHFGVQKVKGALLTVWRQKNNPSVKIDAPLDDAFEILDDRDLVDWVERVEKVEYRVNRDRVLAAWKEIETRAESGDDAPKEGDAADLLYVIAPLIGLRVERGESVRFR